MAFLATAYAALISLLNTISMELTPRPHPPIPFPTELIKTLQLKVTFIVDFLEAGCKGADHLLPRIVDLAYAAEDIIESYVVDLISSNETVPDLSGQKLESIVDDIESIVMELKQIQDKSGINDLLHTGSSRSGCSSSALPFGKAIKMVGFEDEKIKIMEELTGGNRSYQRRVIPIVGMGGIGKTTLAQNIYNDAYIVHHFHVRAWTTISQEYNTMEILMQVLSSLGKKEGNNEMDEECLGKKVYQILCGEKYFVVLDDMWSIDAWNRVKQFFPENNNGSRIMVTTRLSNLAKELSTCSFEIKCQNEENSWSLLCEKVFGQGSCPFELEKVGKQIARNCRGLPLTILVIGGLLAKSKTLEHWKHIAQDFNSFLHLSDEDYCLKILSLSYNHLPIHLKPLFLYMGIFPEDFDIWASRLYGLWIAEGFLKPQTSKTLEEIAEIYLIELVERNLIMVAPGEFLVEKFYVIHDQLRELCLSKAQEANFLGIVTTRGLLAPGSLKFQRRIVIRLPKSELAKEYPADFNSLESLKSKFLESKEYEAIIDSLESATLARSLIVDEDKGFSRVFKSPNLKMLRIFHVIYQYGSYGCQGEDMLNLVNLRYCCIANDSDCDIFFSRIGIFRNLQMLVIRPIISDIEVIYYKIVLPCEIWNLPHLCHVDITNQGRLEPPPYQQEHDCIILENLQALIGLENFRFDKEILKRIPNVKKLEVAYGRGREEWSHYSARNLRFLEKLVSFGLSFDFAPNHNELLRNLAFPHSLKNLSLKGCELLWEDMRVIGMLRNLEVLKLECLSFIGLEWNPIEGDFPRLKYLSMFYVNVLVINEGNSSETDLTCRWNVERTHFPILEKLFLSTSMFNLERIPLDIGEIPTLELIHLNSCSKSIIMSAIDILEEQQSLGNDKLLVEVHSLQKIRLLEGYENSNFILKSVFEGWYEMEEEEFL